MTNQIKIRQPNFKSYPWDGNFAHATNGSLKELEEFHNWLGRVIQWRKQELEK
jgi:hypothetical protein